MARNVMDEIRDEVSNNEVVLYMKGTPSFPMCGFSATVVGLLQQHGRPFAHVNILEDQEKREAIKVYSSWPTIPQLYVGGKFVGGSDIVKELHQSGALEKLLKEAFASSSAA